GEQLAQRLGYLYIDTGAMYRAVAWLALQEGVDVTNGPALAKLARKAEIVIAHPHIDDGRQYTVTVDGHDVTWEIRNAAVTGVVSPVSAHPEVRAILIAQQREMARQHDGTVMVGRDIGAIVLPDADLKIYLTASLQERSRRRYTELVERRGEQNPALPTMEEVLMDIQRRDEIDKDNMRPAEDAIVIVTDNLSVPQVLEVICSYLEVPE
ncbi:MAG TPA: (d)CMP kinase, partial [Ktedonobacteraceae bacterium]